MLVFRAVAYLSKTRVVAVLLAALGVPPGRLQMAIDEGTDPDVGPGRRYRQRLDPRQNFGLGQTGSIRTSVAEAFPGFFTPDSWTRIRDVSEPSRFRRLLGIDDRLC